MGLPTFPTRFLSVASACALWARGGTLGKCGDLPAAPGAELPGPCHSLQLREEVPCQHL